jgi:hypothetical protein
MVIGHIQGTMLHYSSFSAILCFMSVDRQVSWEVSVMWLSFL